MTVVPAVDAAIRILERLAAAWPEPCAVSQLVADLEITRSSCYNILATLQKDSWVTVVDSRGGWTLGPGLLTLTGAGEHFLTPIIDDELARLGRDLGLMVYVAKEDSDGGYRVILRNDPGSGVRLTVGLGDRFPFASPALMTAFWAWRPFDAFREVVATHGIQQFTAHTVVSEPGLEALFATAREKGYSVASRSYNPDSCAVAAPVFDARSNVTMVVCCVAMATQLEKRLDEVGSKVAATATAISLRVGGSPPHSR